jgi:hypothetical protein
MNKSVSVDISKTSKLVMLLPIVIITIGSGLQKHSRRNLSVGRGRDRLVKLLFNMKVGSKYASNTSVFE